MNEWMNEWMNEDFCRRIENRGLIESIHQSSSPSIRDPNDLCEQGEASSLWMTKNCICDSTTTPTRKTDSINCKIIERRFSLLRYLIIWVPVEAIRDEYDATTMSTHPRLSPYMPVRNHSFLTIRTWRYILIFCFLWFLSIPIHSQCYY